MTSHVAIGGDRYEVLDMPASRPDLASLLLLHEGLGSVSMWGDFPRALAAATGARTVAYSRLGFGESSPRRRPYGARFVHEEAQIDLPALRAALALAAPILVGHSTGGSIALAHAAHDPAGVAGVVAMAPLIDVEPANLESIRQAREIFATTAWRDKLGRHHAHPIDAVFASWNDTWLDPGFRDWSLVPELGAIRCRVLALVGRDDPYSSPRQVELVRDHARAARSVEVLVLPDCGHVPYRDQPHATLEAIARFVLSAAGDGSSRIER